MTENDRPEIVCLCGSTRFKNEYEEENRRLTLEGKIVLTCGLFLGSGDTCTPEQEKAIKELHYRKIDLADEVRIVNVGRYVGDSTRSEIAYAESLGKTVTYLQEPRPSILRESLWRELQEKEEAKVLEIFERDGVETVSTNTLLDYYHVFGFRSRDGCIEAVNRLVEKEKLVHDTTHRVLKLPDEEAVVEG